MSGRPPIDLWRLTCRLRVLPTAVAKMVGNLAIFNMDYEEFASSAFRDARKTHGGFL